MQSGLGSSLVKTRTRGSGVGLSYTVAKGSTVEFVATSSGEFKMDGLAAEHLEELMGYVADIYYEGWSDYWQDHEDYYQRFKALLLEWSEVCRKKSEEQSGHE